MCDLVVEVATAKEETPGRNSLLCTSLLGTVAQTQRGMQSQSLVHNDTADQASLQNKKSGSIESYPSV
jgi:hypothetical protein